MNQERIFNVLLRPHITEKTAVAADAQNLVVFKVTADATKPQVKAAVEQLFDVKVADVRVANVKGKTKRTRFGLGKRSDWKKAYVRLEQGQEIDFAVTE
ncbi:50S ribosomal protein L23 [Porticoccus litoralis]|jgi:large subunit ribosomal protein L23|uniref:Large ribosomal subunit protein uL23 n=1 Tax=Porticoccus litoralis TaxID=434086 RepID=A0AAW8B2Q0_9GAMM|nr:50S ribosomal protein L23 [Porticoccus litoralis]MDP1520163.1 50S ribosomal protein L23 [Porticoccus litoralis]